MLPQSNEGILLVIGALFLLLGLLGGGFEISAIKVPPVGKYTRGFAFVIGALVFGLGMLRLIMPPQAAPAVSVPTAPPPTATTVALLPSPVPPTATLAPTQTREIPTPPPATTVSATTTLPQAATIQDIWVTYDQTRFQKVGMVIHVKFSVSGMKDRESRATAYFRQRTGEPLLDQNGAFNTTDGKVSAGESFTPGYEVTQYDNLEIFMPYDELELGPGKYDLQFHVELWEKAHPEKPALAVSPVVDFDFSK